MIWEGFVKTEKWRKKECLVGNNRKPTGGREWKFAEGCEEGRWEYRA